MGQGWEMSPCPNPYGDMLSWCVVGDDGMGLKGARGMNTTRMNNARL